MMSKYRYTRFLVLSLLFFITYGCKKPAVSPVETWRLEFVEPTFTTPRNLGFGYALPLTLNGEAVKAQDIQWSSEDPEIAFVTDEGFVYGNWAGETYVIAALTNGKAEARCKVIVTDDNAYMFRLVLADKGQDVHSISDPKTFLSPRAIDRRKQTGVPIDERDLPIASDYLHQIASQGGVIVAKSKWLATVTVYTDSASFRERYGNLPFVSEVVEVWQGGRIESTGRQEQVPAYGGLNGIHKEAVIRHDGDYGEALLNIDMHQGQLLHQQGFTGAGMAIAVIDAGYERLPSNKYMMNSQIQEVRSFIHNHPDPFALDEHGIMVSACMAANVPGEYVGTAPDADYWLFSTELRAEEYPVEEDYWVAAIEYADSVGVSIVNSSLSYTYRDGLMDSYTYEDMDGATAFCSRGAAVALEKGIFVCNSAGNNGSWVGAPADVDGVLTVGAVNAGNEVASLSSFGMTVDGRMKPDALALGAGTQVVGSDQFIGTRNGTSYSTPILCGLVACLWQAYPSLSNRELLDVIHRSSDRYDAPELPFGYGLPNMRKAMDLAGQIAKR